MDNVVNSTMNLFQNISQGSIPLLKKSGSFFTSSNTIEDFAKTKSQSTSSVPKVVKLEKGLSRVWIPDTQVFACTLCRTQFSLTLRKHHCRLCGLIFCDSCSSKRVRIRGYHTDPQRVCDTCHYMLDALYQNEKRFIEEYPEVRSPLSKLPDSVLINILSFLPYKSILVASLACKYLHFLCESNKLWKRVYFRVFLPAGEALDTLNYSESDSDPEDVDFFNDKSNNNNNNNNNNINYKKLKTSSGNLTVRRNSFSSYSFDYNNDDNTSKKKNNEHFWKNQFKLKIYSERQKKDKTLELSDDHLLQIFLSLSKPNISDIFVISLVCKRWYFLFNSPTLWKLICEKNFCCNFHSMNNENGPILGWKNHTMAVHHSHLLYDTYRYSNTIYFNDTTTTPLHIEVRQVLPEFESFIYLNNKNEDDSISLSNKPVYLDSYYQLQVMLEHEGRNVFNLKEGINNYQRNLLEEAIVNNHYIIAEYLLSNGEVCNYQSLLNIGKSPLHFAIEKRNTSIVQLLLDYKCDPNITDYRNSSALHYAVRYHPDSVMRLLDSGKCKLDVKDNEGLTPGLLACEIGSPKIIESLKDAQGDNFYSHSDNEGRNAIAIAATRGDLDVLAIVIRGVGSFPEFTLPPNSSDEVKEFLECNDIIIRKSTQCYLC